MDYPQFSIWIYLSAAVVILALIVVILWLKMKMSSGQIERELKTFENQYETKLIESQRVFMEKQEAYIQKKIEQLDIREKKLEETIQSIELENAQRLNELHSDFEKKVKKIQKDHEKETEKLIRSIQTSYEKKIQELEQKNEKETDELRLERRKILTELEDYQKNLEEKSKAEMERLRKKYEGQMQMLQGENAKLLDELHRMMEMKQKAKEPIKPPPMFKNQPPKEPTDRPFSEAGLLDLESKLKTTAEEMEKLREQFMEMEKKNRANLEKAHHEIEELKVKIKHGDMRG